MQFACVKFISFAMMELRISRVKKDKNLNKTAESFTFPFKKFVIPLYFQVLPHRNIADTEVYISMASVTSGYLSVLSCVCFDVSNTILFTQPQLLSYRRSHRCWRTCFVFAVTLLIRLIHTLLLSKKCQLQCQWGQHVMLNTNTHFIQTNIENKCN